MKNDDYQVLVASNFKEHMFSTESDVNELIDAGFVIGAKARLKRRITVNFDDTRKDRRKDIGKGEVVSIKGYALTADPKVVCRFETRFANDCSGHVHVTDMAAKIENLELVHKGEEESTKKKDTTKETTRENSVYAKYPFLKAETSQPQSKAASSTDAANDVLVLEDWQNNLMANDVLVQSHYLKAMVTTAIQKITDVAPKLDSKKDIIIVQKGTDFQVWTLRDFRAGTLMFVPETCELKSRFYSHADGRSVICHGAVDPSCRNRPLVIDGRVRGAPKSKTSFALYWMVERVAADADQTIINLTNAFASTEVHASVRVGKTRHLSATPSIASAFQLPILINDEKRSPRTLGSLQRVMVRLRLCMNSRLLTISNKKELMKARVQQRESEMESEK